MKIIRYDRDLQRVWIAGFRLHHGLIGVLAATAGTLLAWHDRQDFRRWLHDKDN